MGFAAGSALAICSEGRVHGVLGTSVGPGLGGGSPSADMIGSGLSVGDMLTSLERNCFQSIYRLSGLWGQPRSATLHRPTDKVRKQLYPRVALAGLRPSSRSSTQRHAHQLGVLGKSPTQAGSREIAKRFASKGLACG